MYNKGADQSIQTVWMYRLACALVVCNVRVDPDQLALLEPSRLESELNYIRSRVVVSYRRKYVHELLVKQVLKKSE